MTGALESSISRTGAGGRSRGPGSAPISWNAETEDLAALMQVRSLPPPASLEEAMRIVQVAALAPAAQPLAEGIEEAAASGATGEAAWQRRVSPRYRDAVRRFFDRED
jgi:hypothetical protein